MILVRAILLAVVGGAIVLAIVLILRRRERLKRVRARRERHAREAQIWQQAMSGQGLPH